MITFPDFNGFVDEHQYDIIENKEERKIVIHIPLAGTKKEDIKTTVRGNHLRVNAKRDRTLPDGEKYLTNLIPSEDSFDFLVPSGLTSNDIVCKFVDGMLTITINRANADAADIEIG